MKRKEHLRNYRGLPKPPRSLRRLARLWARLLGAASGAEAVESGGGWESAAVAMQLDRCPRGHEDAYFDAHDGAARLRAAEIVRMRK